MRRGDHPDEQPERNRQAGQHAEVEPVGRDDGQVPAAQGAHVRELVAGRRRRPALAQRSRRARPRCSSPTRCTGCGTARPGTPPPSPGRAAVSKAWNTSAQSDLPKCRRPSAGRPEERHLAAGHQHQQPVAQVQVGDAVGHHDHRAAVVGELGHLLHHRLVETGVETGGWLVQEQQRWLGQELKRHVDALLLAAGQGGGPACPRAR